MPGLLAVLLLCASSLLASCATPYQSSGFGGGYSETILGENVFQVSFQGNGYSSGERVADLSMLRCAELCLEHGYAYFALVDASDSATVSTYSTHSHANTTGTVTSYGNTASINSHTTVSPGHTYVFVEPQRTNTIVCFKDRTEAQGVILDAVFVSSSIRGKYGIPKER
jgi:hypothetical protein